MLLGLFKRKPLLDQQTTQWLFDTYRWSLSNFNSDIFYQSTPLVLPTNAFFPGRADSVSAMAQLILDRVKEYAAIRHWPTLLTDHNSCDLDIPFELKIEGPLRNIDAVDDESIPAQQYLPIYYEPQQIGKPEALIATFAHALAHHLGRMAQEPPPGGPDYWPQSTELLAIYLGFGLMFANSAFTFRGGCGSCYNPATNRTAYLSELESTYALAIFCVLKDIAPSQATPHLKSHLRSFFKQACKEIAAHTQTEELKSIRAQAYSAQL